jgi:hypothetical protein
MGGPGSGRKKEGRVATRITASFDVRLVRALDTYGTQIGARSRSEALRAVVVAAFSKPQDAAFAAAYQQALAELRQLTRKALIDAVDALTREASRRR